MKARRQFDLWFAPVPGWVCMRELCGHDEELVSGTGTDVAIALLDQLLVDAPGVVLQPGQAEKLVAADRDRLLAAVYRWTFGERIESTVRCSFCDVRFDLDFEIVHLLAMQQPERLAVTDGVYTLSDGRRFRLPVGADELAVAGMATERAEAALLERCLVEGDPKHDPESVIAAMQAVAPLLDVDLEAPCAECGRICDIPFSMQHFLLRTIESEARRRRVDVHVLATAYRWSHGELMSLTRRQRRAYVDLTENTHFAA